MTTPCTRPRAGVWLVVWLLLACLPACAHRGAPSGRGGCPVAPVASETLGRDADLRAQIEIRSRNQSAGFDVVARASGGELIVIGLSPHGTRLFTVRQRGRAFEVEPTSSPMLEQVALWVVDALYRSHWITPGMSVPGETMREPDPSPGAPDDGRRRREFDRPDASPAVAGVTIDYLPPSTSRPTFRIEIQNRWCGYDASVVILEEGAPE
jgi:hypothetical protein